MEERFYKKKYPVEPTTVEGRMPPQALDLEEAVLGAMMLEKGLAIEVLDILKPEHFYKEAHKKIFQAICDLAIKYQPIDIMMVTEQLQKNGELSVVGGRYYITYLTGRVASAAHIEYHSRIIVQKYIQRELIRMSSEIQKRAYDDGIDVHDLLNFAESELFKISENNIRKESRKIDFIIKEAILQIEEASKHEGGLVGIPSSFTNLDRITSGWQNSDLVIIAARPAMGKTAFVLSMSRNIAVQHQKPIAFFSLEMSQLQLITRLIVAETELPSEKIRNGKLSPPEWEQLYTKVKSLSEAKLFIDDTPALSLFELRSKCRRLKMQHNIQLVVIDYLQLMTLGGDMRGVAREQEVSTISRGLKAIAKELNVPIIALSQLNRAVESRSGNRPQLSDLRESGAIEQDADIVIFIHRPEKYGITEDEEGNSTKGIAEIIIAKHRNGAVGDIRLRFIPEMAKFTELEFGEISPYNESEYFRESGQTIGSKMNEDFDLPATSYNFNTKNDSTEAPF